MTAFEKDKDNRARSVAAGVVSGAGEVCRCFKSRTLMRVLRVGSSQKLGATWARQSRGRVGVTGGAGHQHRRKG